MQKRAFTLFELLVVIVIIGIMAAILFPIFRSAKSGARGVTCTSNMKQIAAAMILYGQVNNGLLPPYSTNELTRAACTGNAWWPQNAEPPHSDWPERMRLALSTGMNEDEIWFSPDDPVRKTTAYYLGIRHEFTSYAIGGLKHIPGSDEKCTPASIDDRRVYIGCPAGPGDGGFNDAANQWKSPPPCKTYHDKRIHRIHSDLHLSTSECTEGTPMGVAPGWAGDPD
jgi:prepilin-type N-terminal cleavage/methylation domain-containing protein